MAGRRCCLRLMNRIAPGGEGYYSNTLGGLSRSTLLIHIQYWVVRCGATRRSAAWRGAAQRGVNGSTTQHALIICMHIFISSQYARPTTVTTDWLLRVFSILHRRSTCVDHDYLYVSALHTWYIPGECAQQTVLTLAGSLRATIIVCD